MEFGHALATGLESAAKKWPNPKVPDIIEDLPLFMGFCRLRFWVLGPQYSAPIWLLFSYKVTIMNGSKICQDKNKGDGILGPAAKKAFDFHPVEPPQ